MAKVIVTNNSSKLTARYKALLRKIPEVSDRALRQLMEREGLPLYQATTRTWQRKPRFAVVKNACSELCPIEGNRLSLMKGISSLL